MKLLTVNTIETSSMCDNACVYCPAKDQGAYRAKGAMDMDTFGASLEFVKYCLIQGTQKEVNLFGVGEPLLNPNIVDMVRKARRIVPGSIPIHLNSNGNLLTPSIAVALKNAGLSQLDLTVHQKALGASKDGHLKELVKILREASIPSRVSVDWAIAPNNWAGQVDWIAPAYRYECPWVRDGQIMIQSDGFIVVCCLDAFQTNTIGNVFDTRPEDLKIEPFELCGGCHSFHK